MSKMWNKMNLIRMKRRHKEESRRIRIKNLAAEELPPHLLEEALKDDPTPIHKCFVMPRITEPEIGETLFGDVQKLGYYQTIDEYGATPYIYKPHRRPFY
eukprot:TRINITY_DN3130_c0_g1_i6.p2 TRINITY_DN3130_c0_g1~~TRINITY_DN3130_c0_g1_i6.p2  ORF type:complete len:100 (-),score=15.99 TRINITY_DN3130_c0_g1_i6:50-349(-)